VEQGASNKGNRRNKLEAAMLPLVLTRIDWDGVRDHDAVLQTDGLDADAVAAVLAREVIE
jgi:hypothetical protein